jgi:hypothetical protein
MTYQYQLNISSKTGRMVKSVVRIFDVKILGDNMLQIFPLF